MHLASWKGDLEIVKLLVQQGPSRANVNQQSLTDDTALHMAAQYGYVGVVEFLLEVGRKREGESFVRNSEGKGCWKTSLPFSLSVSVCLSLSVSLSSSLSLFLTLSFSLSLSLSP